jgi:hypothetical protein
LLEVQEDEEAWASLPMLDAPQGQIHRMAELEAVFPGIFSLFLPSQPEQ